MGDLRRDYADDRERIRSEIKAALDPAIDDMEAGRVVDAKQSIERIKREYNLNEL